MMLAPGTLLLNGKYEVEALVGRGAVGEVYRVRHLQLNGVRAIKAVRADAQGHTHATSHQYRDRFAAEVELAECVKHPNVIAVYDADAHEALQCLVMEYMPGGSVADLIARSAPVQIDDAVRILVDTARGLAALHKVGAIHRDVTPANILLGADGTAKIADFGLAQWRGREQWQRELLGSVAEPHPGTRDYMSPEHAGAAALQPTSDIYGLGCVAFELLTGRAWSDVKSRHDRVRDLRPDVPAWLDAVIARMLADRPGLRRSDTSDPERRYVSAEDVIAALTQQRAGPAGSVVRRCAEIIRQRFLRGGRSLPVVLGVAAVVFAVLASAPFADRAISASLAAFARFVARDDGHRRDPPDTGTTFGSDGVVLLPVAEGEFLRGSAPDDPLADIDEQPQRRVYLDAFAIDRTEVTVAQYRRFTTGEAITLDAEWQSVNVADVAPVVLVSWDDADAYCTWVGRRLPTEAEWEKAARGPDGNLYPWGDRAPSGELLNFADLSSDLSCADRSTDDHYVRAAPVGSYPEGASPYGVLDMAGNVAEWVADWYAADYYATAPERNPPGPLIGDGRSIRGGTWSYPARLVRSAYRSRRNPSLRSEYVGFRCAVSPPATSQTTSLDRNP